MQPQRERSVALIIGAPGTGKTTLLRGLLAAAVARGTRYIALDPSFQLQGGDWPGADGVEDWADRWLTWQRNAVQRKVPRSERPTMCVLDDADFYVGKAGGGPLKELWIANRHFDLDVIVTARRAQSLPLTMLSAAEWIYLFRASPADVPGAVRLSEILPPDVPRPQERFEFVAVHLFSGRWSWGRTREDGTFALEQRAPAEPAELPAARLRLVKPSG